MITSKNDMVNELLRLKDEINTQKSLVQEKTMQALFSDQEKQTLRDTLAHMT